MLKDKIAEILENYRDDVVTTNERGTIKDQKVILNQATLAILTAFKEAFNSITEPNWKNCPCYSIGNYCTQTKPEQIFEIKELGSIENFPCSADNQVWEKVNELVVAINRLTAERER